MLIAVTPAFNEATTIAEVVSAVRAYACHTIVVDDGSTDDTGSLATLAGATVVTHQVNRGPGAATNTGIKAARAMGATIVVTIDADGQHAPSDIPALIAPILEQRADIVFANRFGRPNEIPSVRRAYNRCANILTLLATGAWVSDSQCGFKAIGQRALMELDISANGFEFCTQIVREAKNRRWKTAEVPITVSYSAQTMAKGQSLVVGIRTALAALRSVGR